jgi:hypothetical protein
VDYDGDWVFPTAAPHVESLSDLRAVQETSIGRGVALEIKVDAILSVLQWVLAPGQNGRGPDTDAAALRGVVVEGERFGGPKGTVVASVDVWLPDPVGGACRKHAWTDVCLERGIDRRLVAGEDPRAVRTAGSREDRGAGPGDRCAL